MLQYFRKKEFSISRHLINFSIFIIAPLIIINSVLFYFYYGFSRQQLERRVSDHAEVMRKVLNNQLSTIIRLISDKNSCTLNDAKFQQLQWTLTYGLQIEHFSVFYYDKNHKLIHQFGTLGNKNVLLRDRSQDFKGKLPTNEQYLISAMQQDDQGNFYNQLTLPLSCNSDSDKILYINIAPSYWQYFMHSLEDIPGIRVSILDSRGRFIISVLPGSQGQFFNEGEVFKLDPKTVFFKTGIDGTPIAVVFNRSELSNWYIAVAVPRPLLYISLYHNFAAILALGLFLFGFLAFAAFFFSKKLSRPILRLSLAAEAMKVHHPPMRLHTSVKEVNVVSELLDDAYHIIEKNYEDIKSSEERFRLATDVFQGAVIEYDGLTGTARCSPRFYEMFGQDMVWPNIISDPELLKFHPDDREKVRQHLYKVFHSSSSEEEIEYRISSHENEWIWIWDKVAITRDKENDPIRVIGALLNISAHKKAEENLSLVINELNHRVKNTLTIVQSIASSTFRSDTSVEEKLKLFEARLVSLARAHDLITQRHWEGAMITDVINMALIPFIHEGKKRFVLEERLNIWISPQMVFSLTMILHELGTNASKYGALSNKKGVIYLSWKQSEIIIDGKPCSIAELEWQEKDGPEILKQPTRKGFGSKLMRRSLGNDPNASIHIEYTRKGLFCRIRWSLIESAAKL